MTSEDKIVSAREDPGKLEAIYRKMLAGGEVSAFKDAIAKGLESNPNDKLMLAWAYRLDVRAPFPQEKTAEKSSRASQAYQYRIAVAVSILLAICYVVFSRGGPPVPAPEEANPLFWLGWSPMAALAILLYLAIVGHPIDRFRRYTWPAVAVIAIGALAAVQHWSGTGPVANLVAMHLPLIAWAAVGIGLCAVRRDPYSQGYAFMLKSLETVMVGGIYFGALVVFAGLTNGIFNVIGIEFAEESLQWVLACGIGIVPVIAVASVYQPATAPAEQGPASGLTGIVAVISRLILPMALGVLLVYLLWFIPAYFERPFQDRNVLIIYNATILAILVLLTVIAQETDRQWLFKSDHIFRYAVLSMTVLTFLLNTYALAAILYRTISYGLTPNRYACLGWNAVTLTILAGLIVALLKNGSRHWSKAVQTTLARFSMLAVCWAIWVIFILPLSF